jgi:apolipoprotein N-acyltransferase
VRLTSRAQAVPAAVPAAAPGDGTAGLPGVAPEGVAVAPHAIAGRRLPAWLALLAAIAGGLALYAAFPPIGFWPLAAVGPALLVIALWQQRLRTALAASFVFGLAFFVPLVSWTVNVFWLAWPALAVGEAVIFMVLAIGQWLLLRVRAWPLAVAGWWVMAEAARGRWPWGGFPWGRLVMSQAEAPDVRWVAILGPPFLSFLIGLVGACLAWLIIGRQGSPQSGNGPWRERVLPAVALAGATAVALCGAFLPAGQGMTNGKPSAGLASAEIAAIQGNVPHATNLPDLLRAETVTQNHAIATEQLATKVRSGKMPVPNVVIWPENSTDYDPLPGTSAYVTINAAVDDIDRPVLVGAVLQNPTRNTGQLWLPGKGPVAQYIKRKLVPFGEVIPFRSLIAKITKFSNSVQPTNFTPGHRAVVFHLGKIRLGDVICYEVGFDGLVASEVNAGANLLSVQTNDADFELDGQMGETLQQLDMARIRAVEFDRAVAVASTTGVSAIIAPDGTLLTSTRTWTRREIEARVPLISSATLADRLGGWPEAVLAWGTLAVVLSVMVRELRRWRLRRASGPASVADSPE